MKGLRVTKDNYSGTVTLKHEDRWVQIAEGEYEHICQDCGNDDEVASALIYIVHSRGEDRRRKPATAQVHEREEKLRELKQLHDAFSGNPKMQKEIWDMMTRGFTPDQFDAREAKRRAAAQSYAVDSSRTASEAVMKQKEMEEKLRQLSMDMETQHQYSQSMKRLKELHGEASPEHFKKMYEGRWDDVTKFEAEWPDPWSKDAGEFKDWFDSQNGKKLKPEERTMANKFLPFIVDKSTPDHVYRTLLSRSKGMNINLVTSIFYMTMEEGVDELRAFVKTLPDGTSVQQMYEEMTGKYNQYHIIDEDLRKFLGAAQFMSADDWNTIPQEIRQDLDEQDTMAFLYVMWRMGVIAKYTTLQFDRYFEDADDVMKNIPKYLTFSDKGDEMEFASDQELRAFILYHALLKPEGAPELPPIKIVFKKEES